MKTYPPLIVNCPHRQHRHGHRCAAHVRLCGLSAAGWRWVPRAEATGEQLDDEAELAEAVGANLKRSALRLVKPPTQEELFA